MPSGTKYKNETTSAFKKRKKKKGKARKVANRKAKSKK